MASSSAAQHELVNAIVSYVTTMQCRIKELLNFVNSDVFQMDTYDDFVELLNENRQQIGTINVYAKMERTMASMRPFVYMYIKDINSAKMLLASIFENFTVDEDIKLARDELKGVVFTEVNAMAESAENLTIGMWAGYHEYRTDATFESQINSGAEDLKLSLWILENQIAMDNQTTVMQMVQAYFSLMDAVRETYEMLKLPGFIGRRKTTIMALRQNLYG